MVCMGTQGCAMWQRSVTAGGRRWIDRERTCESTGVACDDTHATCTALMYTSCTRTHLDRACPPLCDASGYLQCPSPRYRRCRGCPPAALRGFRGADQQGARRLRAGAGVGGSHHVPAAPEPRAGPRGAAVPHHPLPPPPRPPPRAVPQCRPPQWSSSGGHRDIRAAISPHWRTSSMRQTHVRPLFV